MWRVSSKVSFDAEQLWCQMSNKVLAKLVYDINSDYAQDEDETWKYFKSTKLKLNAKVFHTCKELYSKEERFSFLEKNISNLKK